MNAPRDHDRPDAAASEAGAGGYKLLLVPVDRISALTRGIPQMARITSDAAFEVAGDVGPDRRLRMSREMYDQIEVIESTELSEPGGDMTCDHARPGITEQRATLAAARAMLDGADPETAHEAAAGYETECPACATVAAVSFGIMLAQELAGAGFVNGPLRPRLLAVVEAAQREIGTAPN